MRLAQNLVDAIPWTRPQPLGGTVTVNPAAADQWNAGCPPGFFAQFVPAGPYPAMPYKPGAYIECRKLATATADTVQAESGETWQESMTALGSALSDTAKSALGSVFGAVPWWAWLGVAVVGGVVIWRATR